MSRRRRAGVLVAAGVLISGCGGSAPRQDANEPAGDYKLEIVSAQFPADQHIAERATMRIAVRNADNRAVPNIAVTVKTDNPDKPGEATVAFGRRVDDPQLADPSRPIWVVDREPEGSAVAHTNTWARGRLAPGATATFEWRVTAVQAGSYRVGYEVWPGLDGKARLSGDAVRSKGSFLVSIDDTPPDARVGEDGKTVVRSAPEDAS